LSLTRAETPAILEHLFIHYAVVADIDAAETGMLEAFVRGVSATTRATVADLSIHGRSPTSS
jgi:hypothetical protein